MRTLRFIFIISVLFVVTQLAQAEIIYSKSDSLIYESYIAKFKCRKDQPINTLLTETGLFFLGKPYVASTLESSDKEKLIINLREFDCMTFIENCVALSKVVKSGNFSFSNYCVVLASIRYRKGKIDGYTSRLHYMSDWIYENENSGILTDVTGSLGGEKRSKRINYMTANSSLYKHLKTNPEDIQKLKEVEENINNREHDSVIDLKNIINARNGIENGDLIVFATNMQGLDYSHIAIAYKENNKLQFIHASSRYKKIIIDKQSLANYCQGLKSCNGITVLRITNK